MNLFTPQTGNEKMDKAYATMQVHIASFDDFNSFNTYFQHIAKTDDLAVINKWLLKVLFVYLKQTKDKHDFDKLLEAVDENKREELKAWLKANLEKFS